MLRTSCGRIKETSPCCSGKIWRFFLYNKKIPQTSEVLDWGLHLQRLKAEAVNGVLGCYPHICAKFVPLYFPDFGSIDCLQFLLVRQYTEKYSAFSLLGNNVGEAIVLFHLEQSSCGQSPCVFAKH